MSIDQNVSLARYTSLHVGGPATYFVRAQSTADILEGLKLAQAHQVPFFVLGKGSNVIFPDAGYPGVIIHMEDRTLSVNGTELTAASGVFMRPLVTYALQHNLRGLEELAGIPGTVGGSIRGNAGTWSTETRDHLASIEVLREEVTSSGDFAVVHLQPEECAFGYRDSIFKRERRWIITRGIFALTPGDQAAGETLVTKDLEQRHSKQPYDAPSAGSMFKNPDKAHGIYAGALLESAGLKGHQIGDAQFSTKHANFIINKGHATAADVLALISLAQTRVLSQHHITLELEVEVVTKQ